MTKDQERRITRIKEDLETAIRLQEKDGVVREVKKFEVKKINSKTVQVFIEVDQEGKDYSYFHRSAQIFLGVRGGFTGRVFGGLSSKVNENIKYFNDVLLYLGVR